MTAIRLARGFTGRTRRREVRRLLPRARRRAARRGRVRRRDASGCPTPPACRRQRCRGHDRAALQRRRRSSKPPSPHGDSEIACVITEASAGQHGRRPAAAGLHRGAAPRHRRARRAAHLRRGDDRLPLLAQRLVRPRGPYAGGPPDLFTFGKVMGGGFPAAAFGGRADVMALLARPARSTRPARSPGTRSRRPPASRPCAGCTPEVYDRLERRLAQPSPTPPPRRSAAQGVPHVVQWAGSMFSVFFRDGAVVDYDEAPGPATDAFRGVLPRDAQPRGAPAAERVRGVVRLRRRTTTRRSSTSSRRCPRPRGPRHGPRRRHSGVCDNRSMTPPPLDDARPRDPAPAPSSTSCGTARSTTPRACSTAGCPATTSPSSAARWRRPVARLPRRPATSSGSSPPRSSGRRRRRRRSPRPSTCRSTPTTGSSRRATASRA